MKVRPDFIGVGLANFGGDYPYSRHMRPKDITGAQCYSSSMSDEPFAIELGPLISCAFPLATEENDMLSKITLAPNILPRWIGAQWQA